MCVSLLSHLQLNHLNLNHLQLNYLNLNHLNLNHLPFNHLNLNHLQINHLNLNLYFMRFSAKPQGTAVARRTGIRASLVLPAVVIGGESDWQKGQQSVREGDREAIWEGLRLMSTFRQLGSYSGPCGLRRPHRLRPHRRRARHRPPVRLPSPPHVFGALIPRSMLRWRPPNWACLGWPPLHFPPRCPPLPPSIPSPSLIMIRPFLVST